MAGRASIVGAAETSVGKVREHNEDAHFIDPVRGIFIVCDGMGGHAAGEVASALAVRVIRERWASGALEAHASRWLARGTPDARKQLLAAIQAGATAAHDAIIAEATRDRTKAGMGTTLVAAMVVGGDIMFAHCGDSRAYLVRDGIAMQLTEDHTLLARLLAAGIDVDAEGDGARFKSMLTNALGIGTECHVSTFVVPVADGDRFLLCSDGITEYIKEAEIGEVLKTSPSPARSAQKLVELALARGGGDNATALVIRVLEAGESARPSDQLSREQAVIAKCPLWAKTNTPQQQLRALRIALPRDIAAGEKLPALTLGDRVAWIVVEGSLVQDGVVHEPGALIYPEALLADAALPDKDSLAVTRDEVRALALRADDFRELCDDDAELGEVLLEALANEIGKRGSGRGRPAAKVVVGESARGASDPTVGTSDTPPAGMPSVTFDPPAAPAQPAGSALAGPVGVPKAMEEEWSEPTVQRSAPTPPAAPASATQPTAPAAAAPAPARTTQPTQPPVAAARTTQPTQPPVAPAGSAQPPTAPAGSAQPPAAPAGSAQPPAVPTRTTQPTQPPAAPARTTQPTQPPAARPLPSLAPATRPTAPTAPPSRPSQPSLPLRPPAATPTEPAPAARPPTRPTQPPAFATAKLPPLPMPTGRQSTPRINPSGTTPPGGLFVKPTERHATEQALDRALSELTLDKLAERAVGAEPMPPPLPEPESDGELDAPEIVMEADEPARAIEHVPPPLPPAQDSEPEISISVDPDAPAMPTPANHSDEPEEIVLVADDSSRKLPTAARESSDPEIVVVRPGRAITANDASAVGGTIESKDVSPRRTKRVTDAGD